MGFLKTLLIKFLSLILQQKKKVDEAYDGLEAALKEIKDSINYAERIQRSFLATKDLLNENLNDKAIVTIKKALQIAHDVVPDGYEGAIYSTENPYSYFTAMRILVHLEKALGNDPEAIKKVIDYGKMRLSLTQELESGAIN